MYMSFKSLQGWQLNYFSRKPVLILHNHFGEETFPNMQSKSPLAQPEAISTHPILGSYLGEETQNKTDMIMTLALRVTV